jgi:hypothetical protein
VVPEEEINSFGKSLALSLHRRIELFTKQNDVWLADNSWH